MLKLNSKKCFYCGSFSSICRYVALIVIENRWLHKNLPVGAIEYEL